MSKLQVAVTANGLQFLATRANGKVESIPGDFAFLAPMAADKAIDNLKHEVAQRGNVTRAALSSLVLILQSPRMDGYKGGGDINGTDGLPKELKTAARDAESGYFSPMFKDSKKLDSFLTGIREAGIYATAKGVALKYFWFVGELPCLYVNGHPQTDKLLSVSAMQKIMANMLEDKQPEDKSIARKVLELQQQFEEAENLTRDQMAAVLNNLKQFANEVQQAINVLDSEVTDKTSVLLPQAMPLSDLDKAIAAQWAVNEQEEAALT